MKTEYIFQLSKIDEAKGSLTQRFSFTRTMEAKIGTAVYLIFYLITIFADRFDIGWFAGPSAFIALLGLTAVYFPLILSRRDGSITVSGQHINFNSDLGDAFPASINLKKISAVEIHSIQLIRLFSTYAVLYFDVKTDERDYIFGITIKNKKEEKQYREVLESWYKSDVPLKEYDRMGHRVFKLTEGKNYADIQQIKAKYDITW